MAEKKTVHLDLQLSTGTSNQIMELLRQESHKLGEELQRLAHDIDALNQKKLNGTATQQELAALQQFMREQKQMVKQQKAIDDAVNGSLKNLNAYADAIDDLSGTSLKKLTKALKEAEQKLANFGAAKNAGKPGYTQEDLNTLMTNIQQIRARMAELKNGFLDSLDWAKSGGPDTIDGMQRLIKTMEQNRSSIIDSGLMPMKEFDEMLSGLRVQLSDLQTGWKAAFDDLGNATDPVLKMIRKNLEGIINDANASKDAVTDATEQLKKVTEEENTRKESNAMAVVNNLGGSTEGEIKQTIQALKELQGTVTAGGSDWNTYGKAIEKCEKHLRDIDKNSKLDNMRNQFASINTMSTNALNEQVKFWENVRDNAHKTTAEYHEAINKLKELKRVQDSNTQSQGASVLLDVEHGNFERRTIGENRDAVGVLQRFRDTIGADQDTVIKRVDEAIKRLQQNVKQATDGLLSMDKALAQAGQISNGTWQGTIGDLQVLKKSLEEAKKNLNFDDTEGIKKVDDALKVVNVQLREVGAGANEAKGHFADLNKVLTEPKAATYEELKDALKQCEEQMEKLSEEHEDFIKTAENIKTIKGQIKEMEGAWKEHTSTLGNAIDRLKNYVLVYVGFQSLSSKISSAFKKNLELGDLMSDVQKRTQLSKDAIREISAAIDTIDTRTAQSSLHKFAADAGLLGLKSKQDIEGFVAAANTLNVALVELGDEGVTSLMKVASVTGDVARYGVHDALLRVGSSINALSANSAASAGPMVDFIKRLGAVGTQAKLSMGDIAGIGAALDAQGQSMELSATALTRFLPALQANSRAIANSLKIEPDTLEGLVKSNQTMEAMYLVLEHMHDLGDMGALNEVFKEMGYEGARMKQVFATLAGDVNFLRAQVSLSNREFDKGTSVVNEYNIKNENSAAIMERIGNTITKHFVNARAEQVFYGIAKSLQVVVNILLKIEPILTPIIVALVTIRLRIGDIIKWCKEAVGAMFTLGKTVEAANKTFGKTNLVIGLVTMAVTAAISVFRSWGGTVSELDKSLTDMNEALEDQKAQVSILFSRLNDLKQGTKEYKDTIAEINSIYGKLINYTLSDASAKWEVVAAQNAINEALAKQLTLQGQKDALDKVSQKYKDTIADAREDLFGDSYVKGLGAGDRRKFEGVVGNVIQIALNRGLGWSYGMSESKALNYAKSSDAEKEKSRKLVTSDVQGSKDIADLFYKGLQKAGFSGDSLDRLFKNSLNDLINYYGEEARKNRETKSVTSEYEKRNKANQTASFNTDMKNANQARTAYENERAKDVSKMSEDEQRKHYANLVRYQENYRKIYIANADKLNEDQKANFNKYLAIMDQHETQYRQKAGLITSTGLETHDVMKMSYQELDAYSKRLMDEWDMYSRNGNFRAFGYQFGQKFNSFEEAQKWVAQERTKIKKHAQDDLHRTAPQGWHYDKEGSESHAKEKKELKELMDGMIEQLKAYYTREKEVVEQARADRLITEEQKNKQLRDIAIKQNEAEEKLRRDFIEKQGQDLKHLTIDLVTAIYGDEADTKKRMEKIRKLMAQFGQTMLHEIEHKADENALSATEERAKRTEELRQRLLEYDEIGKMFDNIRKDAEEADILMSNWGTDTAQYQNVLMRRMTVLFDLMKDAYNMNAAEMEDYMREHGFGEWADAIFQDDVKTELFVNKIRDYYDKWLDTVKKETERLKKRIDFEVNSMTDESGMTLAQRQQARMLNAERQKEADEALNQIPYLKDRGRLFGWNAGTNEADNAELEILRLKIELEQELMDKEEERFNAEMEQAKARLDLAIAQGASEADLANARAHIEALQLSHNKLQAESLDKLRAAQANYQNELVSQYATAVQRMQPYADAVVQFSESFGEGVFGSKEDRQKAAWELLRSVTNTTLDLLKQEAIRVATKAIYQKMELANTQAVLAQENAARTAAIIQQLGVEKAAALGLLTMEQAKSTANAFGKSFWVGLAVSAAIAAAFAGLQGLINGAINKAQSDISASSGGRMATGMLAYAEGKYPVMGQDGKVYDARYESKMRTGVYRGGAHFGIFSEKEPEMVLSGHTTRAVLNEPMIANAIMTLDKYGRLPKDFFTRYKMQTHADGTLKDFDIPAMAPESSDDERMAMMYERVADALSRIDERLSHPIEAKINMYGPNGLDESIARRDRYNTRNARR